MKYQSKQRESRVRVGSINTPKRFCVFIILFTFSLFVFSQNNNIQSNFVSCEVVENKGIVSIKFGDGIKYLGEDYPIQIGLYNDDRKLVYDSADSVVNHLMKYGWQQCGNPTYKTKENIKIYFLIHKIDKVLPNLDKQIKLFLEYESKNSSKYKNSRKVK